MTGRVVDFTTATTRRQRAEANKQQLHDQARQRTQAARDAAAATTPPAQQRGYARYLSQRDTERAREAWERGQVIPHRITTALDLRALYGPEVDAACGVEEPAVDEWEQGVRYPTWEQLLALAELTGFPVKFFTNMLPCAPIRACDTTLAFHTRGHLEGREPVLAFTPEAIRAGVEGCCVACLDPQPGSRARHTCEQAALF
jgi:transcriptional regulator with XRE-family HTH domain